MNVLVLNCGSSSIKFQIIDTDAERIRKDLDRRLVRGIVERFGDQARVQISVEGQHPSVEESRLPDHRAALEKILGWVVSSESGINAIRSVTDLHAVGHRVVHGGERFAASVRIDQNIRKGIEECIPLAPLHNPANLSGIRAVEDLLGQEVPQVAVFDTAFHTTMPEVAFLYGLPYEYYRRHRIRRYGFHGTSHRYVSYRFRRMLDIPREKVNIITLHLGNGCSACAIKNGVSFDTSMGFTPLEGLLMGTRSGDVDASILPFLSGRENVSLQEIDSILNERSGLLGVSGSSSDMRDLLEKEAEEPRARLAIELFCHRVRKYIGAYHAALAGAEALVFTGGIGENSPVVRERICQGLEALDLHIDPGKNRRAPEGGGWEISEEGSSLKAYVIPTDEELLIARDTYRVLAGDPPSL